MADWTRRTLLTASGLAVAAPALASPPRVIPVWPNGPPGGEGVAVTESVVERNPPPNPLRVKNRPSRCSARPSSNGMTSR